MTLRSLVLFLHILVAIVAFGPTMIFPLIGKMGEKEPMHGNFALRLTHLIESRVTVPLAIIMPGLGVWLIYLNDWDLWRSEWLIIAIVLYTANFFFATQVQSRWLRRAIELTGGHAEPPPAAAGEMEPAPVAGAQMGPPPEFLAVINKIKFGGTFLTLGLIGIVLMMVWKPGGEHLLP